jgi:serine/threonine-protein kinase
MSSSRWDRIAQLYEEARALPAEERAAFLDAQGDEPKTREEVVSLLDAREQAGGFFDALAEEALPALQSDAEEADEAPSMAALDLEGRRLGPYRLDEEIGTGGMGVVYRAVRVAGDFEQTVAVKLLRPLLPAADAADRFRAERQVLARLDHPNIARLIDGGVTERGRPYLVMEHVDGVPLTAYAERHDLNLEARLDLLQQVLGAVRAAHRQLVVHRDLKPSNVLVTEVDGAPRVKLLDFGIAKLLDDALPVARLQTRTGQRLMTPAYAAPEQVSGDEITTATDVYQLGVLAYELLAGTRPFDLAEKSLTEVERILLDEEPAPPSDVAGTGAGDLRGDLDTIVLTALRKEPDRRYGSVEALAADLERYRAGEPVEARPATLGYRAKKFVSRNRTAVGAGVLVLLLGVAYAVTVTVQANRLAAQRDRAQREAETTKEVKSYLVGLFRAGNPMASGEEEPSAEDLLQRGIEQAGSAGGGWPIRFITAVSLSGGRTWRHPIPILWRASTASAPCFVRKPITGGRFRTSGRPVR